MDSICISQFDFYNKQNSMLCSKYSALDTILQICSARSKVLYSTAVILNLIPNYLNTDKVSSTQAI